MPQEVGAVCATLSNTAVVEGRENLQQRVEEVRRRLDESATLQRHDAQAVRELVSTLVSGLTRKVCVLAEGNVKGAATLSNLPVMVKGVLTDTLARMEQGSVAASNAITTTREQLARLDAALSQAAATLATVQRTSSCVQDRVQATSSSRPRLARPRPFAPSG